MYKITWEDFDRWEEYCEEICVESRTETRRVQKWVCDHHRSGALTVPEAVEIPKEEGSVRLVLLQREERKGDHCHLEWVEELIKVCTKHERKCGPRRALLGDTDLIDLVIEDPSVSGLLTDKIEVVLKSGPRIDWWKAIQIVSATFGKELWNKRDEGVTEQTAEIAAEQWAGLWWFEFKKAKFLGVHTGMYQLYDLQRIQPGSRVTFTWVRDS